MRKSNLKSFFGLLVTCLLLSSCSGGWEEYVPATPASSVEEVTLSDNSINLQVGEARNISAFMVGGTEEDEIEWISNKSSIVSVTGDSESATIVGLKAGQAFVSARAGQKMATCSVTVGGTATPVVSSITLSETSKILNQGESFALTADIKYTGTEPAVTYTSSNSALVKVEKVNNGLANVTAIGEEGVATIAVTASGVTATCEVTVEKFDPEFYIKLDKNSLTLDVGSTQKVTASYAPSEAMVSWVSADPEVATVDNGNITGVKAGKTTISASVYKTGETDPMTATCEVTVRGKADVSWSKPGHLYLHYLRTSDTNYDKWALWIWQNYPNDLEGSLWGASYNYQNSFKGVTAETFGHMTNEQCGGVGTDEYCDEYGIIIDVDLTKEDLLCGKSRTPAPLISDWSEAKLARAALGFLIVDQTKMDGSDNWVSDGGAETYIKTLGSKLPEGKDSYLHIYCVEGNVSGYSTESGKQTFVNPTATDTTGNYRSVSDNTILKRDSFTSGVSTSSTFLEDRPGTGYQIFVPSFRDSDGDGFGDLRGIIESLDYLEDLGVDCLWLTPIQESNSYHGYDVTDYYKIDSKFGTLQDYQELIYKAHQKGMKVLMDMVINHTSKSNVLFQKSQKAEVGTTPSGKPINYRDMYLWKYAGDKVLEWDGVEVGTNQNANFKQVNVENSADWYRDGTSNYYYYGKFGRGMAELNYSCQATRDYMTDMCKYWLSFGLDGFRLDAIKHIYLLGELDPAYNYGNDFVTYDVGYRTYWDSERAQEVKVMNDYSYDRDLNVIFWKQFAGTIKSAYPNCFLVGENFDGWNARIAPFYESIDSQFDFSTYYHLHESTGNGIVAMGGDIQATLNYNKAYRKDHINGAFTSNHDVARFINHCASTEQSAHHAEINPNNASQVTTTLKRARWDSAITLLAPGLSWIYYGDEIGLGGNTGDKVPNDRGEIYDDKGNNTDRWYRQPMRWGRTQGEDGVVKYTFNSIDVLWDFYSQSIQTTTEQQNNPNSLFSYFKALCAAKGSPDYPTYGYIVNQWGEGGNQNVLCMQISDGVRTANVFVNATDSNVNIDGLNQGTWIGGSDSSHSTTYVPANGFVVLKK